MLPLLDDWSGQAFYLDVFTRVMIVSIAALSLNLIVGYGGMISLGHAAYLGLGAYSVGIPAYYGVYNGWVHLLLALSVSGLFALITGMISLRTRGVYFIMITLAFAQMMFYTLLSLEVFGGDDGLVIELRSEFQLLNLDNSKVFFYLVWVVLVILLYLLQRLLRSRFGLVVSGCRHNHRRMSSLGYDVWRYQLLCYVIAAMVCGLAGMLLANFSGFISPGMSDWLHSAELLFMIVLGGTTSLTGPILGSSIFLLLEEWLSNITVYWQLFFGLVLVAVVMAAGGGIAGLIDRKDDA